MNPQSPREEIEIRITALLMGELSPDEAAALHTRIAADAELTALHARLGRALGLLREACAIPEQPAPPVPARLSDERRERLLAHFQGAKPGPVIVKPRRDWKWAVPLGLAASLIALIGGAVFVNGFALRKDKRSIGKMLARSGSENLADSAESTVMSQIRKATQEKDGAWASQPGMIRVDPSAERGRVSSDAYSFNKLYGSVDELHDASKETQQIQPKGGAAASTPNASNAPGSSAADRDRARFFLTAHSRSPELNLFGRPRTTVWPSVNYDEKMLNFFGTQAVNFGQQAVTMGKPDGTGSVYLPSVAENPGDVATSEPRSFNGMVAANPATNGKASTSPDKSVPGGEAGFFAGSFWDTPRVQTYFDRGMSGATASFRGGLATSQPIANEFQRYPRETGTRSRDATGDVSQNRPFDADPTGGDVSKSPKVVGAGGAAVKEAGKKASTIDLNGYSDTVGGLVKTGSGKLTLSGANTYTGGTTITGGTLHGQTAGGAGGGAKPGAQPADPKAPGKPTTDDHFASYKTEGESRVALGTAHREVGVVELKGGTTFSIPIQPAEDPLPGEKRPVTQESLDLALKDLRGTDGKSASQGKPSTTSLGLAWGGSGLASEKLYAMTERLRDKGDTTRGEISEKLDAASTIEGVKGDTNGRAATYDLDFQAGTTFGVTRFALGNQPASAASGLGTEHKLGDVRVDYGSPRKETDGPSPRSAGHQFKAGDKLETAASEDGRKTALDPHVTEFEGFIKSGSAIAGKPGGAPAPALPSASTPLVLNGGVIASGGNATGPGVVNADGTRWIEVTRDGTLVNPAANATDGARRSDDNPVVGRIAFWADDDTAKVNINTAGGYVSAQEPSLQYSGAGNTNTTFSGVITGAGDVALNKAGTGNWQLNGANTFGGGTTVNDDLLRFSSTVGTGATSGGTNSRIGAFVFDREDPYSSTQDFFNKQITHGHRAKVVAFLPEIVTAGGYTDLGRYDLAERKSEEIQGKDHYNIAASKGREEIANLKDRYARAAFNDTRATEMWEVDKEWARPYRRLDRKTTEGKDDLKKSETALPEELSDRTDSSKNAFVAKRSDGGLADFDAGIGNFPDGAFAGKAAANPRAAADVEAKRDPLNRDVDELQSKLKLEVADAETESDLRELLALDQNLERQKSPEAPGERGADGLRGKSDVPLTGKLFGKATKKQNSVSQPAVPAGGIAHAQETFVDAFLSVKKGEEQEKSGDLQTAQATYRDAAAKLEKIKKESPAWQQELVDFRLKRTTEATERLEKKLGEASAAEAEKVEAKKEAEKLREAEAAAPKPAPNPLVPQPEIRTGANAFSTFSLNVSDVAFKLAGASLEHGTMPDVSTLRSEEFINAFDYRDPEPAAGVPLGFVSERARYPFAQNRDLLRLSVKTAAAGRQPGRPLNIVLLLDNSGSMERADRVRIVREALRVLSAQLQPQDKLSIVTFSRTPRLWADGVAGDKAGEVTARVGEITPEGGTNLAAALDLGYATALRHYQAGSINHVVVLTDGAANLGNVDPAALKQKVEAHRKQGVALDCFGIGWEGLNDDMLEQLSRNGDGRYGFINTPEEAAVNFAAQLAGALRVAASDVKVQVEWNPRRVTAYRQVGYAKHQLTKEQFRDNTVDAAEIGAAESGNALYVVEVNPRGEGDLGIVRVRFKVPGTSDYREHEWAVPFTGNAAPLEQSSSTLRLAATASAFSEMLAASPFATEVTSDRLLGLLNGVPAIYNADPRPKKLEWMIRQAKSLSGR